MKKLTVCLCLLLAGCVSLHAQSWRDDRARLCFVRPENNGVMNTLESWVRLVDYDLPLVGGQAVCLYVESGKSELRVTSRYPYDPKSKDDEACKSRTLQLSLNSNDNRTFMICPATKGDHYTCGWRIASLKPNTGCDDQ